MSFRSTTRTTIPNANFIPTLSKEKMIINEHSPYPYPYQTSKKQKPNLKKTENREQKQRIENKKQKSPFIMYYPKGPEENAKAPLHLVSLITPQRQPHC